MISVRIRSVFIPIRGAQHLGKVLDGLDLNSQAKLYPDLERYQRILKPEDEYLGTGYHLSAYHTPKFQFWVVNIFSKKIKY